MKVAHFDSYLGLETGESRVHEEDVGAADDKHPVTPPAVMNPECLSVNVVSGPARDSDAMGEDRPDVEHGRCKGS